MFARMTTTLSRWMDRWQLSESVVLGGAALVVGLTSGIGVWLFKWLIQLVHGTRARRGSNGGHDRG